jgi:hypothetical protein
MWGGRYWVRTSDLFGVNEARYHCANRPLKRRPPYLTVEWGITELGGRAWPVSNPIELRGRQV